MNLTTDALRDYAAYVLVTDDGKIIGLDRSSGGYPVYVDSLVGGMHTDVMRSNEIGKDSLLKYAKEFNGPSGERLRVLKVYFGCESLYDAGELKDCPTCDNTGTVQVIGRDFKLIREEPCPYVGKPNHA